MENPCVHVARVSHTGSMGVGKYRRIWETRNIILWENMGNFGNSGKCGKRRKYDDYRKIWETGKMRETRNILEHIGSWGNIGQYGKLGKSEKKYGEILETWKLSDNIGN